MIKNIGWSESRKELERQRRSDLIKKRINISVLCLFAAGATGVFIFIASKSFVEWITG